jgi:hypothetical protein
MPGALEATPTGEDKLVRPRIRQEVSARADTVEMTPVTVDVSTENQRPKVAFDLHDESELSSSKQTDGTGDDQLPEWTDVKRKRGRNSPSRESSTQRATSELSREQDTLIKLAENNLTEGDRKRIAARQRTLNIQRDRSLSREEGPSRDKGKAPDPANWGDLDLEDGEVDLDAQRAALESFRLAWEREDTDLDEQREVSRSLDQTRDDSTPTADAADKSAFVPRAKAESAVRAVKDKLSKQYQSRIEELEARLALTEARSRRKKQDKVNHPVEGMVDRVLERASSPLPSRATPQAMAPIQQVAPRSYVGRAMGMDKPKKRKRKADKKKGARNSPSSSDDDSTSSSSSESSSSESSESSESSSDESESSDSSDGATRKTKRRSSKKKSCKSKSKKNTLKPIPPISYDGAADSRAFHQFLTEGTAYVKDGQVERKKRVFILAHYLKGRAREFYTREVSGDPYR